MNVKNNPELYQETAYRLRRMGLFDPTSQIIALAEEVEMYRSKIQGLIEHYEAQTKPGYVVDNTGKPAVIELRPRCSKCGAPLENVAGKIIRQPIGNTGMIMTSQRVTPDTCPCCGAYFEGIQQTVVPVEVE